MADLFKSKALLFGHEGVYSVNDPDDPGGETVFGVAREKWPNIGLWAVVDKIKKQNISKPKSFLIEEIEASSEVRDAIDKFYRAQFWDKFGLDHQPQIVADEIFEQSVNIGVFQCTKHIQRTCNILNRNGSLWEDTIVDGVFGKGTREVMDQCIKDSVYYFVSVMNLYQGAFYLELKKEKYIRGWSKRAIPILK